MCIVTSCTHVQDLAATLKRDRAFIHVEPNCSSDVSASADGQSTAYKGVASCTSHVLCSSPYVSWAHSAWCTLTLCYWLANVHVLGRSTLDFVAGITYDKSAILKWIEQHRHDPTTQSKLEAHDLSPNLSLRNVIQSWIDMRQ